LEDFTRINDANSIRFSIHLLFADVKRLCKQFGIKHLQDVIGKSRRNNKKGIVVHKGCPFGREKVYVLKNWKKIKLPEIK